MLLFRTLYIEGGTFGKANEMLHVPCKVGWLSRLSSKELCVGLMWACSENQTLVVARLLACHHIFRHQASLASCVLCAVKRQHLEVVRLLTADLRVPLDITNKQGLAPLQTTDNQDIKELLRTEQRRYIGLWL